MKTRVIFFSLFLSAAGLTPVHAAWVYGGSPYLRPAYGTPYWGPQGAALGPWKWSFVFGGGPTTIVGPSRNRLTGGWNFNVGGGYNFTPRIGLLFEFNQSGLGLTDADVQRHQADDGDASVWGITANPVWRFRVSGVVGAYVTAGGGFYQRELRYLTAGQVFVPTFGGGGFFTPATFEDRELDNTGGVNAGGGFTFNVGGGTKFFVEARYHYVFTGGSGTQLVPVTFGFRW
jgi:hypothetical protein